MCTSNRPAPPQGTLGKNYWKLEFFLFSGDRVLQIPTVSILPQKDIPDNGLPLVSGTAPKEAF